MRQPRQLRQRRLRRQREGVFVGLVGRVALFVFAVSVALVHELAEPQLAQARTLPDGFGDRTHKRVAAQIDKTRVTPADPRRRQVPA